MQIQFTGNHIDITPAIREYTEKKLKRLENHLDYITNIHVTFSVDKLEQIAEATINVPNKTIVAKAEAGEMYGAIDALTDKLVRQLNKYREKVTDHR